MRNNRVGPWHIQEVGARDPSPGLAELAPLRLAD